VTLVFAAAIFGGAALVFLVQPMIAKAILPTFGGTPQVWNAALVFFQGALLAGYGYAHVSSTRLGTRRQAIYHVAVLLLPLAVLPIALRGTGLIDQLPPAPAVVAILAVSVGLPYVVISSTSPLLQQWFSTTGHRHAADPYFLYAAGNAGSLLGLLAYPFVIEPRLTLLDQTRLWSIGYVVVGALIAACALVTRRARRRTMDTEAGALPTAAALPEPAPTAADVETLTGARRLRWIAWAAIPSSLLLGVTTHLQTDIAAVPLLWVIPLTLYLVTFVLAFSRLSILTPKLASRLLPFLAVAVAATLIGLVTPPIWLSMLLHYSTFFVAVMLAHGRLADDRPHPRHLTEYFFLIAVGGVLGGAFNALIAPVAFDRVVEYPLALVLVLLVRPGPARGEGRRARRAQFLDLVVPLAAYLGTLIGLVIISRAGLGRDASVLLIAAVLVASLVAVRAPLRQAGIVAAVLAVVILAGDRALFIDRTFFGVNRVIDDGAGRHVYLSGMTVHGLQRMDSAGSRHALGYYHPSGPAGHVFQTVLPAGSGARDVAIVGLGAGGLAAYNETGHRFVFYEIDPAVITIARDERLFGFLADAPGDIEVIEGDGRLRLAEAPPAAYDLIVLDAFSSDAVPAHLLTTQAMELYLKKLKPDGVLLFNVTNTYLDVRAVVAGGMLELRLAGLTRVDTDLGAAPPGDKELSEWVAGARTDAPLAPLAEDDRWRPITGLPRTVSWTDDFSDVISVLR
jgi:SAM-dependent methyltransferase